MMDEYYHMSYTHGDNTIDWFVESVLLACDHYAVKLYG